jgi:hypothetical protein
MSKTKTPVAKVILGDGTLSKDEEERLTPLAVVMKRVRARLRRRRIRKR